MPTMRDESMLRAIAAGLAVVGLFSIPAFTSLVTQLSKRHPKEETYKDEDGKATAESVKAYSARWPKAFVLFFAAGGSRHVHRPRRPVDAQRRLVS